MDRRQKKTREAIFGALTDLLSQKRFDSITVSEIIERADVGRATFYAHFETKDSLLKALCEELFCHIFDAEEHEKRGDHRHIFSCEAPSSVILHLFRHLQRNDNHILELLACESNALFLRYFKENLTELIRRKPSILGAKRKEAIPDDFWLNHAVSTLVETVRWWVGNRMRESPETLSAYFLAVL